MPYLTVFTPTYNRVHTLERVFESLKRQKFKDFEWLIIDDGSTDNTADLVEKMKKEADFVIRYYWKENGGIHTARNFSYPLIKTKYVISMDSDDEFADGALEKIRDIWESMTPEENERFWQVSGRCKDSKTGKMIGKPYPDGINDLTGKKQHKARLKCPLEKHCCRKTEILRQYPFPEFSDVKDITGDYVWEQIDKKYDTYCTNEIFRIYETDSDDSLGNGKGNSSTYRRTQWYFSMFCINELFSHITYDRRIVFAVFNLPRLTYLSNTSIIETIKTLNKWYKKLFVVLAIPVSFLIMCFKSRDK